MADEEQEAEFVYVKLADHGAGVAPGRVSRASYDEVWKDKGWKLVSDEDAAAATVPVLTVAPEPKKKG